ncbi:MAG TPA: phosphate ABC transporter permease PstA [Alphaproteobacteria bacterium]|jgi:phosphate transport system permease protein
MTDARSAFIPSEQQRRLVARGIRRRRRAEWRFQLYGIVAIVFAVMMLGFLLVSVVSEGWSAFLQTNITLEVALPKDEIDPDDKGAEAIGGANFQALIEDALFKKLGAQGRDDEQLAARMLSAGSDTVLRNLVLASPALIGKSAVITIPANSDIDMAYKGRIRRSVREQDRQVKDKQFQWIDALATEGALRQSFNWRFFALGDSNEPELAGILGALSGSAYTMLVTLLLCFPVGVSAAIYLEEFAPKNRVTDLVEVNINNLAAVPSIVFGLLGLAVFLNFFGLPRSAPLVGGMVMSLLVLPTIIIATRASLKAVPPSIREAAYGLGASKMQVITHHVLPLAMPGVLTGTIIGMAHALGETAPLLMIGMKAFIAAPPVSPLDPATALPAQVFIWADKPERGFQEKTAAAIIVLLVFLVMMNALAVYLRRKFERRW